MKLMSDLLCIVKVNVLKMGYLLLLILLLFPYKVRAIECDFSTLFHENISIPVIGLGISTAGEDIPVGKVLYSSSHALKMRSTIFNCTMTNDDLEQYPTGTTPMNIHTKVEVIATPSGAPTSSAGVDIYPTNIPGIGVSFSINSGKPFITSFPGIWDKDVSVYTGTVSMSMNQISMVDVTLVKTGPIQQGIQQVLGSSFPTFQVTSGSRYPIPKSHIFVTLNFSGATTVHTKTCQLATPNINVELGGYPVSDLDSPGKATKWKNFDIVLQKCPPFYGYGEYKYNENSGKLTGSNTDNVTAIVFRSANGVVEGNPLLARLDNNINAATGVGIELSRRDISGSIPMDGSGGFNLPNLSNEDNTTYTIPLKARYVQTDTTVKPGPANGSVIFTITYL